MRQSPTSANDLWARTFSTRIKAHRFAVRIGVVLRVRLIAGPEDQGGRRNGESARRTRPAADQHHASHQPQATVRARTRRPARRPSRPAPLGTRRPDAPAAEEPRTPARHDATTSRPIDHVPGLSPTRSMRTKGHVVTTQPCAHPVGMRRPALAQAPAFRVPGGAAVTPRSSRQRKRRPPTPEQAAHTISTRSRTTTSRPRTPRTKPRPRTLSTDTGHKQPRSEQHQPRGAANKQKS